MRRQILLTLLFVLVLPATGASAAPLPAGTTAVLSGTPDLTALFATPAGDATIASSQALDRGGTQVVFTSNPTGSSTVTTTASETCTSRTSRTGRSSSSVVRAA